jgi:hypothetical protein
VEQETRRRAGSGTESQDRSWLSSLLTLRNLVLTTAITVLVSTGVTAGLRLLTQPTDDGDPVEVTVIRDPADVPAFGPPIDLVLPASASTDGSPGDGCSGFHEWATARGGVDADQTRLQVIVRGADEGEVVVNGMRVEVLERGEPLRGINVQCPTAGTLQERRVSIDLDDASPGALYRDTAGRSFGFTVEEGEVESFLVTATTDRHLVRWRLSLDLVAGGARTEVPVLPEGQAFSTSATRGGAVWAWGYEVGGGWTAEGYDPVPTGGQLPAPSPRS